MKKVFLLFAVAAIFVACAPNHRLFSTIWINNT